MTEVAWPVPAGWRLVPAMPTAQQIAVTLPIRARREPRKGARDQARAALALLQVEPSQHPAALEQAAWLVEDYLALVESAPRPPLIPAADDRPTVIVEIQQEGGVDYAATAGVRLLIVDENAPPHDRVYEISTFITHAMVEKMIMGCRIGRRGDMPGAEKALAAMIDGVPPPLGPTLTLVGSDTP